MVKVKFLLTRFQETNLEHHVVPDSKTINVIIDDEDFETALRSGYIVTKLWTNVDQFQLS